MSIQPTSGSSEGVTPPSMHSEVKANNDQVAEYAQLVIKTYIDKVGQLIPSSQAKKIYTHQSTPEIDKINVKINEFVEHQTKLGEKLDKGDVDQYIKAALTKSSIILGKINPTIQGQAKKIMELSKNSAEYKIASQTRSSTPSPTPSPRMSLSGSFSKLEISKEPVANREELDALIPHLFRDLDIRVKMDPDTKEKILSSLEKVCHDVSQTQDVEHDETSSAYKFEKNTRVQGFIDKLENEKVLGWLFSATSTEDSTMLTAMLKGLMSKLYDNWHLEATKRNII